MTTDFEQPPVAHKRRLNAARDLLPGWLTERMMSDTWSFGLMMSTGITIAIERIDYVWLAADNSIWLDVTLMSSMPDQPNTWTAPCSRTTASINTNHVMAAFELTDT